MTITAEAEASSSGADEGLLAQVHLLLGRMHKQADRAENRLTDLQRSIVDVPIFTAANASGSQTIDLPDQLGPRDGWHWDVRRITCWGFSAGTVAVYRNDANGEQLANFTSAGQFTWSGQLLLGARDRLIFVGSTITGTIRIGGSAIAVADRWWADYLR